MNMPWGDEGFGFITGVEKGVDNDLVEHVEVRQDAGRGHRRMLVDVPAELLAQLIGVRQAEPRPVGSPQTERTPAPRLKTVIKQLGALPQQIPEKRVVDFVARLYQGAFGGYVIHSVETLEKMAELDAQALAQQR